MGTQHKEMDIISTAEKTQNNVPVAYTLDSVESDITKAHDEYIAKLHNADDIYKTAVFNGLIDYIHRVALKPILPDNVGSGEFDITLLGALWDYYIYICAIYDKIYTIPQYCSFVSVLPSVLRGWYLGNTRKINRAYHELAQKIYIACESATLGKTVNSNSIGAMFLLKSRFHYAEETKQVLEIRDERQRAPEEIIAQYREIQSPKITAQE